MSLRLIESFDHYGSSHVNYKWTTSYQVTISGSYGRFGGNGAELSYLTKTFDSQQTWIVGFALNSSATSTTLLQLKDGTTVQIELVMWADGRLAVYRHNTGSGSEVLLGNTSWVWKQGWHYIELKVYIDNSAGTVDLYVDGVSVLSLSGQDTQYTANASANIVNLCTGGYRYVDDIYICDGQGATNNDVLGDCKVECLFPSADGSTVQFTPSAGSNYENVDDTTPDGDSTYNEDSVVGHKDLFEVDDLVTLSGNVYGVQANVWAKKSDAGSRSMSPLALSGAVETSGSSAALSTGYLCYSHCFETSPSSGSIWTISEVNAAEFGYEVTA